MLIDKPMVRMIAEYSEVIKQQHAYELHMILSLIIIFAQALVRFYICLHYYLMSYQLSTLSLLTLKCLFVCNVNFGI